MKWTLPLLLLFGACAPPRPSAPVGRPSAPLDAITLLVEPVDGLALFRDESRVAEEALFAWGRSRGLHLVPIDRATEIFERARVGRRVDGAGEACGLPLTPSDVRELDARALGATGILRAEVACGEKTGHCTLDVMAFSGTSFDGDLLEQESAPYDVRAPWQSELSRALAALRPVPDDGALGGLGIGGIAGDGVVRARPEHLGWSASAALARDQDFRGRDAIHFAGGPAPLRACFAEDEGNAEALIAVDPAGRITRCESRDADDALSLCACAALLGHAETTTALRDTRAFVGIHFQPADVVTPWRGVVTASTNTYLDTYRGRTGEQLWRPRVSDPSIEPWKPPPDTAIARCFADAPSPGRARALVTVRFDSLGAAAAAEVRPEGQSMTGAQMKCVERAFLTSRAPCPAPASSSAQAAVEVTARTIGEK